MDIRGYVLIAGLVGIAWFLHRDRLQDSGGNATAKPVPWAWASLLIAVLFVDEFLRKLGDPFYQRHPENYYVLWAFIGLGLFVFVFARLAHVTVSLGKVIEHSPPLRRKEISIADLRQVEDAGAVYVLRSADYRTINIVKAYSGVVGVVEELRRIRPDLFKSDGT